MYIGYLSFNLKVDENNIKAKSESAPVSLLVYESECLK